MKKKLLCIFLVIISFQAFFIGCTDKKTKEINHINKVVLKLLNEKYNKEFEIVNKGQILNPGLYTSDIYGTAYPTDNKEFVFKFRIDRYKLNEDSFMDSYISTKILENGIKDFNDILDKYYSNYSIKTDNYFLTNKTLDESLDYKSFFKIIPENFEGDYNDISINIYFDKDSNIDIKNEKANLDNISKEISALGLQKFDISLNKVENKSIQEIKDANDVSTLGNIDSVTFGYENNILTYKYE